MTFTIEDKYREVVRELTMRRSVYPRWIKEGRLTREQAERQIEIMVEIALDYSQQGVLPL
jgi:hypothetical protein